MSPEIRRIRPEELSDFLDSVSTSFLERPDIDKVADEVRPNWDLERTWGAFDGGRVCGTFRSWATELTVPGGAQLPGAAVSAVTVRPTHRRRGILRGMVAAEHGASRERGEALAVLHASEYPIYGRFGYGPATRQVTWTVDALVTGFHGAPHGRIEQVRPGPEVREAIRDTYEAYRVRQVGELRRREPSWDYDLGRDTAWGKRWNGFVALHHGEAGVDGYVRYHVEEKWERNQPRNVAHVDELHGLDRAVSADLWRFMCELDLVSTVIAERRSQSDPLPWLLTNARAALAADGTEAIWVRLFDIPRALEARTYERSCRLVLEIVDPEAGGGRLRVELDAGPAGARCRTSNASPDLTLHVAALGAAYLGGAPLRSAVLALGADEHRPGALAEADALFRTLDEPWCSTFF